MDLLPFLILSTISILVGVILTLISQYYLILVYFKKSPVSDVPRKSRAEAYSLPEALKKELEKRFVDGTSNESHSSLSISLILQFLFHELRHSDAIKRWLYKKLSMEFDELLTKTTIGKFFETVTIRDMDLGSQFPDIKNIKTEDVKLHKAEGHIDTLNICVDLDYNGNFSLSVDAKMKFGKTAYLSIKVKRLCGSARLQFTRYPYTHWSFSFYDDPILELALESHFQGRQLQANITNLILHQIKKAFKRKHTLPNYKIRYKPFFVKTDPAQLDLDDSEIVAQGKLSVTCCEVTRLAVGLGVTKIYYTIAVDTIPWIMLRTTPSETLMVLELTVTKLRQTNLGMTFKQSDASSPITVDSVTPNTVASVAGFKPGDTILSVQNRPITTIQQLSKVMKTSTNSNVTFRIERSIENYILKSEVEEGIEVMQEVMHDSFVMVEKGKESGDVAKGRGLGGCLGGENVSKIAQTLGSFGLRKRKASPGSTPLHVRQPSKQPSMPEIVRTDSENLDSEILNTSVVVYKGQEVGMGSDVLGFNKEYVFNLKEGYKYLNINVWGVKGNERDVLLGYANVPLAHILYECCSSVLGHFIKRYSFLPPSNVSSNSQTHPLTSHSGFEHVFCYGDVLLSFVWTHDGSVEIQHKPQTDNSVSETQTTPASASNSSTAYKHNFVRTQFHGTTHCDFCTKKIWLKDAVQCKDCRLSCHKKCVAKCQTNTDCFPIDRVNIEGDTGGEFQGDGGAEAAADGVFGPLKRVNSANNLSVPGSGLTSGQSLSLPPSPQRTPSRKQSLCNVNPFQMCPEVLEEVWRRSEAGDSVCRLLEEVMLYPQDDALMSAAKETGLQLYVHMPHEERVEKINLMVTELKKSLDSITTEHTELSKQLASEESEVEKAKLAFLMGQADAKVHGLSVLMLHYCSGLQQTQEKIV